MAVWAAGDMGRQDGKRVLVTGGASGIGFQAARAFGAKGAHVTVLGRDAEKGGQALEALRRAAPEGEFALELADLASLQSIAACAERVLARGQGIDLLLNVAGVMAVPVRRVTADGFEMQMGTNHLGHFALTGRLLPLLKKARVVQVTALVARWAKIDFENLQSERKYSPMRAYAASKLANVLFAVELAKRGAGMGLSAVAVDPGTAKTNLQRHTGGAALWLGEKVIDVIGYPLERVADPVAFGAVFPAPDAESYVRPSKFIQKSGPPAYAELPKAALDAGVREKLWEISERLTGVQFEFGG